LALFIVVLFVPGCRNHIENATNNITPFGLDTYTITYGGRNYSAVRTIVYKAANQHCEKQGKSFSLQNEDQQRGWNVMRNSYSAELDFRCLRRDDPEFRSPDEKKVPNPVIEN